MVSQNSTVVSVPGSAELVPDELPEPIILRDVYGRLSKQVLPIIEELFVDGLRDLLMTHINSPDQTGFRVHAYRFGKPRGWVSKDQELAYHLENLRDQRSGKMTWAHVVESVDWFASQAPRTAEAVEPLRMIRDRMADTWKSWGGEAGGKGNKAHALLRDSADRALHRMGGR